MTVKHVTDESAKAVVKIGEPGTVEETVHLRYGPVSDDAVQTTTKGAVGRAATEMKTAMGKTTDHTAEITVANLIPDQEYVLEASLDDGFTRGVERITFHTDRTEPGTVRAEPVEPAVAAVVAAPEGAAAAVAAAVVVAAVQRPRLVPSDADFTWNVTRDFNSLHGDHTEPHRNLGKRSDALGPAERSLRPGRDLRLRP